MWFDYLESLKRYKIYLPVFIIDAVAVLVYVFFLKFVGVLITSRSKVLMRGASPADLQNFLTTASESELTLLASQMRNFIGFFVFIVILVILVTVIIYSLSRFKVWTFLENKKFDWKVWRKWNWLPILFSLFVLVLILVLALLTGFTRAVNNVVVSQLLTGVVFISLLTIFSLFSFVVKKSFVHSKLFWRSVGDGFSVLVRKKFWVVFLFGFFTLFILQLVQRPFSGYLFLRPILDTVINVGIILISLAWLRTFAGQQL